VNKPKHSNFHTTLKPEVRLMEEFLSKGGLSLEAQISNGVGWKSHLLNAQQKSWQNI